MPSRYHKHAHFKSILKQFKNSLFIPSHHPLYQKDNQSLPLRADISGEARCQSLEF